MARFQAQTNTTLDEVLEELRVCFGLRRNQKADLLRELAVLAGWVVRQATAGRSIEAHGNGEVQSLVHPTLDRLRDVGNHRSLERIVLDEEEASRLAEILDRGFAPTPDMLQALRNLADPQRRPPELTW